MGGRVSDIAIDPRNPAIFFVGLSTGGLFKTGDNGVTFDSTFDKQPGAINRRGRNRAERY